MFEGMVDIATQLVEKASRCRCQSVSSGNVDV